MRSPLCSALVFFVFLHVMEARRFRSLQEKDRTGQKSLDMMLARAPADKRFPALCETATGVNNPDTKVPKHVTCNEYPQLKEDCIICLNKDDKNTCTYYCKHGGTNFEHHETRPHLEVCTHVMVTRCSYLRTRSRLCP